MSVNQIALKQSDLDFKRSFTDHSLPEPDFTHESYLRMGWIYIAQYSLTDAIDIFAEDLKEYTQAVESAHRFNMTSTWLYLMLINECQQRSEGTSWETFKLNNPDLFQPPKELLSQYYSEGKLSSEKARHEVVLPDLISVGQLA